MNTGKSLLLLRKNKIYAIKEFLVEPDRVTNKIVLSPENNPSIKIQINILNCFSEISTFYLLMDALHPFPAANLLQDTGTSAALPSFFVIPTRG